MSEIIIWSVLLVLTVLHAWHWVEFEHYRKQQRELWAGLGDTNEEMFKILNEIVEERKNDREKLDELEKGN